MKTINLFISFLISLFFSDFAFGQKSFSFSPEDWTLTKHWEIQSSKKVGVRGNQISSIGFKPHNWYPTSVPRTVLASLVEDGQFKNVFFDRNLQKIPENLFQAPWWYRTTFQVSRIAKGMDFRLRFNGINYKANVWINGICISMNSLEGSFRRFSFDISKFVHTGTNVLAVLVTRSGPGDLAVGFVDWNPEPPDHDMGIWRTVHLLISGPVSLSKPFVRSTVDTQTLRHASLIISVVASNHSGNNVIGQLSGQIGKDIRITQTVSLAPHQIKTIIFDPKKYNILNINNPRLWWTHNLGKPNLYHLKLTFKNGKHIWDKKAIQFGIRTISTYFTSQGFRGYRLNGRKILIEGGGWTDPMLLNATPEYEEAGVDYAVQMNLNSIRMEGFWGHDQHIYDLCDEKGILIMVGFSCQWEWQGTLGTSADKYSGILTPEQNDCAAASWKDQITWLRNHPSIFLWLYGSDKWPRPSLEKRYLSILAKYDPTRPYAQSAAEHTSEITGPSGMKMRGPYDYVPPDYWYIDRKYGGAFGFNTETGPGPEVPVMESLKKMIPADSLWPIGSAWLFHSARGNFHNLKYYNQAMVHRLGPAKDLKDYLRKAQYLNYEGMRAMFEAFESNRFNSTGIIQWMYNASWPKLWWQFYDYYLMPTAAFYAARKACEPIHISYNYGNSDIEVMGNSNLATGPFMADIRVLNFNLKAVFEKVIKVKQLNGQESLPVLSIPSNLNLSSTYFLDLKLFNYLHKTVSSNFYVLSTKLDSLDTRNSTWYVTPESQYANLRMLQNLPEIHLEIHSRFEINGKLTKVFVSVKNPSKSLAFMIHFDLRKSRSYNSVTPIFWDDNYITLLPGESRFVSGKCFTRDLKMQRPIVSVDGWNVN